MKITLLKRIAKLYRYNIPLKNVASYALSLKMFIPNLTSRRPASGKLMSVRYVHRHLSDSLLSKDDLTDFFFCTSTQLDIIVALNSVTELRKLSKTANIIDTIFQKQRKTNSKAIVGQGKIEQIILSAVNCEVSMMILNLEFTPSQNRIEDYE